MTCYFNVIGFLSDEELHQVWDICAEAMERKGWDVDNSELSIRAYDDNLRQNVDSDTVCEPSPFDEHPYIMNGNMTSELPTEKAFYITLSLRSMPFIPTWHGIRIMPWNCMKTDHMTTMRRNGESTTKK